MCGRYSLIADLEKLARRFEFDGDWLTFESACNVAPTQDVLTAADGEAGCGGYMRWGLIPHWAKNASIGSRMPLAPYSEQSLLVNIDGVTCDRS